MRPLALHLALAGVISATLAGATPALAQATITITAPVPGTIDLETPTAEAYNDGWTAVGQLTFQVTGCPSASNGCAVLIWATAPSLGSGKAIDQVQWQLNGTMAGSWQPLAIQEKPVVTIPAGAQGTGTIYVRVRLSWAQDPADRHYAAPIRLGVKEL